MSQSPEDAPISNEDGRAGMYDSQYENRNPEADARAALAKGDLRLLGFALRATVVPGVAVADRQTAMDACGVRLMKGFGDVIRSDDQATAMQQAHEYAKWYNAVVLAQCLKKD